MVNICACIKEGYLRKFVFRIIPYKIIYHRENAVAYVTTNILFKRHSVQSYRMITLEKMQFNSYIYIFHYF